MGLTDTKQKRLAIIIGVVLVYFVVAGIYSAIADRQGNEAEDDLLRDLRSAYAATTIDDATNALTADWSGDDRFWRVVGHPEVFGVGRDGRIRGRWAVERWGERRCVVVTWTKGDAVSFSHGAHACELTP